ncbi:MAG: dihydrolipoamide dehydrogenase [Nonlabens sp.]
MKKIFLLLLSATVFIACEGDQGPPGFDGIDGRDGRDGLNVLPLSFEQTVNFSAPEYENFINYSDFVNINDVGLEDMTLVYILFDQTTDDQGNPLDVWRLLPQTLYSDFGEYQYNYDATNLDVRVFLDGPASTDFTLLGPGDLENQTFRVVILPVDYANDPTLDVTDYNNVMQVTGLGNSDFIKIE